MQYQFHILGKIDIDPKLISEACAQAAKEAYDIGETNDEEKYKEDMEEMLEEILYEKQENPHLVKKLTISYSVIIF